MDFGLAGFPPLKGGLPPLKGGFPPLKGGLPPLNGGLRAPAPPLKGTCRRPPYWVGFGLLLFLPLKGEYGSCSSLKGDLQEATPLGGLRAAGRLTTKSPGATLKGGLRRRIG